MTTPLIGTRLMNLCVPDDTSYLYGTLIADPSRDEGINGWAEMIEMWDIHRESCTGAHVLGCFPGPVPAPMPYDKYDPLAGALAGGVPQTQAAPYWARWLAYGLLSGLDPHRAVSGPYAVAEPGVFGVDALAWLVVRHLNLFPERPLWVRTDAAVALAPAVLWRVFELREHITSMWIDDTAVYAGPGDSFGLRGLDLLSVTDLDKPVPKMEYATVINSYLAPGESRVEASTAVDDPGAWARSCALNALTVTLLTSRAVSPALLMRSACS